MEPAQTPAEIRETLEGTQTGGVKNSIRNCLTVFQRDPLFRGALRLNLLTEQVVHVHVGQRGTGRKLRAYQREKGAERHQDCCQMCIRDSFYT